MAKEVDMLQFKKVADGVYEASTPFSKYRIESWGRRWVAFVKLAGWRKVGAFPTKESATTACDKDFDECLNTLGAERMTNKL